MNARVLAASIALAAAGCMNPAPTSARVGPAPGAPAGTERRGRTQAPPAPSPYEVPTHVGVVLSAAEGRAVLEWIDASRRTRAARPAGSGVSIDGSPPASSHRIPGPVSILGRSYDGELVVERHPEGGLRASVRVPLEDYVEGVVASETSIWSAAPAELEAQAIAARTFAAVTVQQRRSSGLPELLTDGVLDQAFRGRHVPGDSNGARDAALRLSEAVRRTRGMVLARGTRLEEARYHAACGGHTASFADVFRREVQERGARGPSGVPCRPCYDRARSESERRAPDPVRPLGWIEEIAAATLARIGQRFELEGPPSRIAPTRIDDGGRWLEVALYDSAGQVRRVEFDDLRRAVGYADLKSGVIAATVPRAGDPILGGAFRVQGRGRGHGVGLCQEGMRDLARAGWTSRQILAHYYPGTRLQQGTPTATAGSASAR